MGISFPIILANSRRAQKMPTYPSSPEYEFPRVWLGLEDFDVYFGGQLATFGLSLSSPEDLRKNLTAAAMAFGLGHNSIDYVRKRYKDVLKEEPSIRTTAWLQHVGRNELLSILTRILKETTYAVKEKPDVLGLFAADMALIRIVASFRSALELLKLGFYIEALTICRLIIEQLAWIYDIHEKDDESFFNTPTSKSIGKIRRFLPELARAYGQLSEWAHLAPHVAPHYVSIKDRAELEGVIIKSPTKSAIGLVVLFRLLDYTWIISEYIYRNKLRKLNCIYKRKNRFHIKKKRPLDRILRLYSKDIIGQSAADLGTLLNHILVN